MKTLRYILVIILIIKIDYSNAQNLKGIYISSHTRDIRYETEIANLDSNGMEMVKLDAPQVDTFYSEGLKILDFVSKSNIRIKHIDWIEELGKYKIRNGKIKIKSDNFKAKGIVNRNDTIILIDRYAKKSTMETFFIPISESDLISSELPDSQFFYNSNWIVQADTSSINYGFDLHFLDSSFVIISQKADNYGYTSWGELKLDSYKNHLFIGIINRGMLEHKVYHVTALNDSVILADNFEHWIFAESPPEKKRLRLIKVPFPNETQYNAVIEKITGNWLADGDVIPFDNMFGYDTLINQSFEIDFSSNFDFTIKKTGILIKDSIEYAQSDTIQGKWELGETCTYVELHPINDASEFITIKKITNHSAEFYMDIKAFEENFVQGDLIKLNKINWP